MIQTQQTDRWPMRWLRRGPSAASRVHTRHACCLQASLEIRDRNYSIEGLIFEISLGGVLFREASRFILDRVGLPVTVRTVDLTCPGTIVNVRPEGYGIRFNELLDETVLEDIVARFGVT